MGTTLGAKVSLGPRVRIDRPWLATVGRRTTAEADVWFKIEADTARLVIGEFCFLGRGVELDCTQAITIGDRVLIAPGVFITDHNHRVGMEGTGRIVDHGCVSKSVVIADDVWVGHGATILPGVTISRGAVIGAGAVVTKNVPEFEIWAGIPAVFLRHRDA